MARRKRLPAALVLAWEAFHLVIEVLEPAKAGLVDAVPGSRLPGRPLEDALAAFQEGLEAAGSLMPAWRTSELGAEWDACEDGLRRARSRARRAQVGPQPEGFEGLLGLVQELLDPLEPFAVAEARFRRLRRRT